MTLYESIMKATSGKRNKRVFEDAAGSVKGSRNVADSGNESDVQKAIINTLDTASKADRLKAMSVIAHAPGNDIFNKIAKGANGIETKIVNETLAESIKRTHNIA